MYQRGSRRERICNSMFHIGQIFLYLFFTNLLLSTVVFVLGLTVTSLLFPLSLITAFALLIVFYDQKFELLSFLFEIIAALLLIAFCIAVFGQIYDFSYDGNAYHKLAEGMLVNGWNPLFQVPDGAYTQTMIGHADTEMSLWLECYPKATEIFAASVYAITGNVESGKIYTVLGMIAAFFLTAKLVQNRWGILFAGVAALNPVAVAQMDTFYVDGLLHIHVYLLAVLLFAEHADEPLISKKTAWSLILAVMTVLANIKYTGLFFGAFFCAAYYFYEIAAAGRQLSPDKRRGYLLHRTGLYALTAVCSVVWGGATAYITNILRYGNPVYTLIGEGSRDIFSVNSPFPSTNHGIIHLMLSLFSKVGSVFNGAYDVSLLKLPFTVDWQAERPMLGYPDIRLSGFGVLFGGLFLVSAIVLLVSFCDRAFRRNHRLIFLNVMLCLALMVIIEQSWWARYAPYCWIFFLLGLYILLNTHKKRLFMVLVVLSICNSLCWTLDFQTEHDNSAGVRELFSEWGSSQTEIRFDYTLNGGYFPGMCYNLKDFRVPYKVDLNLDQTEGGAAVYNGMAVYSIDESAVIGEE